MLKLALASPPSPTTSSMSVGFRHVHVLPAGSCGYGDGDGLAAEAPGLLGGRHAHLILARLEAGDGLSAARRPGRAAVGAYSIVASMPEMLSSPPRASAGRVGARGQPHGIRLRAVSLAHIDCPAGRYLEDACAADPLVSVGAYLMVPQPPSPLRFRSQSQIRRSPARCAARGGRVPRSSPRCFQNPSRRSCCCRRTARR